MSQRKNFGCLKNEVLEETVEGVAPVEAVEAAAEDVCADAAAEYIESI